MSHRTLIPIGPYHPLQEEAEFFQRLRKESLRHARIVAFGSTRKPMGQAGSDPQIKALLQAETPTVIVVGKTWKAKKEPMETKPPVSPV